MNRSPDQPLWVPGPGRIATTRLTAFSRQLGRRTESTFADFRALHDLNADHAGLLLVYRDNDPTRDMTAEDILRAIANLSEAGLSLSRAAHTLNHWQY